MNNILIIFLFVLAAIFGATIGLSYLEYKLRKSKPFIGTLIIVLIIFAMLISSYKTGDSKAAIVIVCILLLLPVAVAYVLISDKYKDHCNKIKFELIKEQNIKHNQLVDQRRKSKLSELTGLYGSPTTTIELDHYDVDSYIMLFQDAQVLKLGTQIVPFKDIVSHRILKNSEINRSARTISSSLQGNYSGRTTYREGIVHDHSYSDGSVSVGVQGYISGGTDYIDDYLTLAIQTDDLSNPTIFYEVGYNNRLAQRLSDMLAIIERRNKTEQGK